MFLILVGNIFPNENIPRVLEELNAEIKTLEPLKSYKADFSKYKNTFWLEQGSVTKEKVIKIIESLRGKTLLGIKLGESHRIFEAFDEPPYVGNAYIPKQKAIYIILDGCLSDMVSNDPKKAQTYKDSTYGLEVVLKFYGKFDRERGLSSIEPATGFNQVIVDLTYSKRVCIPR